MKKNDLEIRSISSEVRLAEDSRTVSGYAMLFDTESQDLGFIETIQRGALTQQQVDESDVFALFNHNSEKVLARSRHGQGSLHLTVDDRGLYYEFDAPHTAMGDELLEHLRRGEVTQSSFAFAVDWNDQSAQDITYRDGVRRRTIHKIALLADVSPVFRPAYNQTTCAQRALDEFNHLEDEERQAQELARKQEVEDKLRELEQQLNAALSK